MSIVNVWDSFFIRWVYTPKTVSLLKKYNRKGLIIGRPNLMNHVFKTEAKNKSSAGRYHIFSTKQVTLYLAVFLDFYNRIVTGWTMDTRVKNQFVVDAFQQDIWK